MVQILNIHDKEIANEVLKLQLLSYQEEAKLIQFYDIPPLKDRVDKLIECDETFYGYFEGKDLVGLLSFKIEEGILDIHRVCVHPAHFRKGIGMKLLDHIEEMNTVIRKIIVCTGKANTPAIKLYVKKGFCIVRNFKVTEGLIMTELEKFLSSSVMC